MTHNNDVSTVILLNNRASNVIKELNKIIFNNRKTNSEELLQKGR